MCNVTTPQAFLFSGKRMNWIYWLVLSFYGANFWAYSTMILSENDEQVLEYQLNNLKIYIWKKVSSICFYGVCDFKTLFQ